ncbi:hypothetical protein KJ855_03740 [Patescibacteria group bacterium]|nr:hypothetical protein [Patescibacteria group bacterium]
MTFSKGNEPDKKIDVTSNIIEVYSFGTEKTVPLPDKLKNTIPAQTPPDTRSKSIIKIPENISPETPQQIVQSHIEREILPAIGRLTNTNQFKLDLSPTGINYFAKYIFNEKIDNIYQNNKKCEKLIIDTTAQSLFKQIERDNLVKNFDRLRNKIKEELEFAIANIWYKIQLVSVEKKFTENLNQKPLLKPIFLYRELRQTAFTNIIKQYENIKSSEIKNRTIVEIKGINQPYPIQERIMSNIKKIPQIVVWGGVDPDEKKIHQFLSNFKKWSTRIDMQNCLAKIDCHQQKVENIFAAIDKSLQNIADCANHQIEQIATESEIDKYERIQQNVYSTDIAIANLKQKRTYAI